MEMALPRLRLDLDTETFETLLTHATAELRPVQLQAEVLLRQALGLPFPYLSPSEDGQDTQGRACLCGEANTP